MTVRSLWDAKAVAQFSSDLAQRVYTSRLLGRDKTLVQHGGGNTSVKIRETNLVGDEEDIIYVKGSGWDLETIEAEGFAPLRLDHLLRLAQLDTLSDPEMANELATHMTRASAPAPSVEAILHALIPHKFVDHTHADAIVAITNTRDGARRIAKIYGDAVVVIPYVMPGFALAKLCADIFPKRATSKTIGMVLLNHGIFSFGDTARESYERMIRLVQLAEKYLTDHCATDRTMVDVGTGAGNDTRAPNRTSSALPGHSSSSPAAAAHIAQLRRDVSAVAGFPVVMRCERSPRIASFIARDDVATISQQGPATPDHVIRTKRVPMIGRDTQAYAAAYKQYFEVNSANSATPLTSLDPAPRVILDPEVGMCTIGRSAKDAAIVADLYSHTIDIIERAELLGGYEALPQSDIFDVEYWDLEQAKLRKGGKPPMFAGEVALVTGAASGIGKACVQSLLARGAAVVGIDVEPNVATLHDRKDFIGVAGDVTAASTIENAIRVAVQNFGGLDILVLNAGVLPASAPIADLTSESWRDVMNINVDSNLALLRACHPLLKLAPNGGRVAIIGSKNVPAPGTGMAAYSSSKAALTQLGRIAALEWGRDNIRVNIIHPDAVFDTGLWSTDVIDARAAHYGLTPDEYRKRNLLGRPVTSTHVAELAAEMCGPLFASTTGAQIPVDGGNERVI